MSSAHFSVMGGCTGGETPPSSRGAARLLGAFALAACAASVAGKGGNPPPPPPVCCKVDGVDKDHPGIPVDFWREGVLTHATTDAQGACRTAPVPCKGHTGRAPDCTAACPPGYTQGGNAIFHCRSSTGRWQSGNNAPVALVCTKKECPLHSLPLPQHAQWAPNSDPRCGDAASWVDPDVLCNATCLPGYYQSSSGESARKCQNDGQWSGRELVCTRDDTCSIELEAHKHSYWDSECDLGCDSQCTARCASSYRTKDRKVTLPYTCSCPDGHSPHWEVGIPNAANAQCFGCSGAGGIPAECDCDGPPVSHAGGCLGMIDAPCKAKCAEGYEALDADEDRSYRCEFKNASEPTRGKQ